MARKKKSTAKPAPAKPSKTGSSGASGKKVALVFGSVKPKGQTKAISLVARVPQSAIDALEIKLKPSGATAKPALIANKSKKAKYVPNKTGTKSARRSLRCSVDGVTFVSVIVPTGCSYGLAIEALSKNSKAKVFKTPSGRKWDFLDPSKK